MYVDGFVVPVFRNRLEDYRALAEMAADVWIEQGALSVVEAAADDVPDGKLTSFPMAVDLQDGEVAFFSYITYRDRTHRDAVNAKVMADPRMNMSPPDPPMAMDRMIYGGFSAMIAKGV